MTSMMNNPKQLATFLDYLPLTAASGGNETEQLQQQQPGSNENRSSESSSSTEELNATMPNNGSLSGYSSELSGEGSVGGSSEDAASGSTSGGDLSSVDIDEIADLNERIEFLQAKQQLLEKATRVLVEDEEDLLTVSKASKKQRHQQRQQQQPWLSDSKGRVRVAGRAAGTSSPSSISSLDEEKDTHTIWTEAADILHKINGTTPAPEAPRSRKEPQVCNPKNPAIRAAGVKRLSSVAFDGFATRVPTVTFAPVCETSSFPLLAMSPVDQKHQQPQHWMAQALIQSTTVPQARSTTNSNKRPRRISDSNKNSWKVVASLHSSIMTPPSLVPPAGCRLFRSIDMADATTPQTTQARLVTQATPPFLVVYANRAFWQLVEIHPIEPQKKRILANRSTVLQKVTSTLPVPKEHCEVLGRPVESLLQMIGGLSINDQPRDAGGESLAGLCQKQGVVVNNSSSSFSSLSSADCALETERKPTAQKRAAGSSLRSSKGTGGWALSQPPPQQDERQEPCLFDGLLIPNGKRCSIQVVPVVDRSRKRTSGSARKRSGDTTDCMSHVMVQVQAATRDSSEDEEESRKTTLVRPQALRIVVRRSSSSDSSSENSGDDSNDNSPRLLGTVG